MAKHAGHNTSGATTSQWLNPQNPYTGDGRTSRQPHDPVTSTTVNKDGERIRKRS